MPVEGVRCYEFTRGSIDDDHLEALKVVSVGVD